MANVTFHIGTATPPATGLTPGGLYVDSANGQIFYSNLATSKKQIGSTMKMMQDKGWTLLNGTTGTKISNLSESVKTTILNYASEVYVQYKSVPFSTAFPNISGFTQTVSLFGFLVPAPGNPGYFTQPAMDYCRTTTSAKFSGGAFAFYTLGLELAAGAAPEASIHYCYCNESGNMAANSRYNEANDYLYIIAYKF